MDINLLDRYKDLIKIFRKISSSLNPDEALEYIINSAAKLFKAKDASLILIDEKTCQFYFGAVIGEKKEEVKCLRFPIGKGIAGWVAKNKKPLLIDDVSKDLRFNANIDKKSGFKTDSICCVPLEIRKKIIGVLQVINPKLKKPFTNDIVEIFQAFADQAAITLENARIYSNVLSEKQRLQQEIDEQYKLITVAPSMLVLMDQVKQAAKSDSTILIYGESGTGKELIARAIHNFSLRKNNNFIAINCATLSDDLIGSELFGHEKGAFTGAYDKRIGKLEEASKGSFFLDEVGELKSSLQSKILRVIQERKFQRIGGNKTINTDVRIIGATNRDLLAEIKNGNFRKDLFYRLNVIPIIVPPLRNRKNEIPELTNFFLNRYSRRLKKNKIKISPKTIELFMKYNWPGNVRELENVIERAVVFIKSNLIKPEDIILYGEDGFESNYKLNIKKSYKDQVIFQKKKIIKKALNECNNNQKHAAKLLGLQASYFSRLIKELKIK